jgi:hypothetical protein
VQNPVFHPLVERKIKEEGFRGYKAQNIPNSLRIPFFGFGSCSSDLKAIVTDADKDAMRRRKFVNIF